MSESVGARQDRVDARQDRVDTRQDRVDAGSGLWPDERTTKSLIGSISVRLGRRLRACDKIEAISATARSSPARTRVSPTGPYARLPRDRNPLAKVLEVFAAKLRFTRVEAQLVGTGFQRAPVGVRETWAPQAGVLEGGNGCWAVGEEAVSDAVDSQHGLL